MQALSFDDILKAWEYGQDKHPVERGLILLASAYPEFDRDALAALSLGQRNHRLLELREQTIGSQLKGTSKCPSCSAEMEFAVQVSDIKRGAYEQPPGTVHEETFENYRVRFRLPNTHDLRAVVRARELENAQAVLKRRVILEITKDGEACEIETIPGEVLEKLGERMTDLDPQAEVLFAMACIDCKHRWSAVFDIILFFWTEIAVQAKRVLNDVAVLARAFGWSEREILEMSPTRRLAYLNLVPSYE